MNPIPILPPLAGLLIAILIVAILAGFFGALAGLGGGMILQPIFVLYFGLTFGDAVGASAIGVLATSLTTGAAFSRERIIDMRIANLIVAATVPGALVGATLTVHFAGTKVEPLFLIAFGAVLVANIPGCLALRKPAIDGRRVPRDAGSHRLGLEGDYLDRPRRMIIHYRAKRVRETLGVMFGGGIISGLLGIGRGVLTVLTMDRVTGLPIKVSTTTSKYIVGVDIMASLAILFAGGLVQPTLAAPVAIGTIVGAYIGGRVLPRMQSDWVRWIFLACMVIFGIEELIKGVTTL